MKKIPQLLKTALTAAAALMIIALPGCHKEDAAAPAPSDASNAAQPAPEQLQPPQETQAQDNSQPLEAPKAPEANAAQDLQMLKDAADAKK
ncbi:MAG: hypothetical protein IKY83_03290 [Proteobacteria bacterium]|nr:hypothetical protein [Pseudomonadota bacterium]